MTDLARSLGFIGLGSMGEPMALNLLRAGAALTVWNRSSEALHRLLEAGASTAGSAKELMAQVDIVILMLADEEAMDAVLDRGGATFAERVKDRIVVHMGTTAASYSSALEKEIRAVGGCYVEAPVSGSRKPAETGQLIGMLAGESDVVAVVRPLLKPICRETMVCGAVPNALLMKLAVNLYLISMVTGLAEAVHFAEGHGLDTEQLMAVLNAGPMASDVSRVKLAKLTQRDLAAHASIADVLKNNRLVAEAARARNLASPLLDVCHSLYREALAMGHGKDDMVAVLHAYEARTHELK
jgi:3-hydroxyisobutyrate dehydrogenase